jgi:hypothetical protein
MISKRSSLNPTKIPPAVLLAGRENQLKQKLSEMTERKLGSIFSFFVS